MQNSFAVQKKRNIKQTKIPLIKQCKKHRYLLLLMVPGLIYYIVFKYIPIYGLQLAFKDFIVSEGIWGSPWVGLKYIRRLFKTYELGRIIFNTVNISALRIIFGFPAPIILALCMNELKNGAFKRTVQTITYLPHFLSWVVISGLVIEMLSPSTGVVGFFANLFGTEAPYLMTSQKAIIPVIILSAIWKEIGYGTIIYLAAMSNIDPQLYEAAVMEGCGRFRQAMHITLPGIIPVATIMLILSTGNILNGGFDQIFNMTNAVVQEKLNILDIYIFKIGLEDFQYSFTTAVGLVKNLVAFGMVFAANSIVRKFSEYAIW